MVEELLAELGKVYLRLLPSPVHGIGVFAVRDIPKGCRDMFSKDNGEWIKVPVAEVEKLPDHTKELVYNYCTYDSDHYYIEKYGLKRFDISCFLNHSEEPNIKVINDGEFFEASRDIKAGEEIFINYGDIAG
jgi:SET domain-containing protein